MAISPQNVQKKEILFSKAKTGMMVHTVKRAIPVELDVNEKLREGKKDSWSRTNPTFLCC